MIYFIYFGTLNTKVTMKRLDWLKFPRKINKPTFAMAYTLYP